MPIRVTITEEEQRTIKTKEWKQVAATGGKDGGAKFDYVTKESDEIVETKLYEQRVDKVDLKGVIDSVNKPPARGDGNKNANSDQK